MSQVIQLQFDRQHKPVKKNCPFCSKKCASRQYSIAIVDDDAGVCGSLKWLIEAEGYSAAIFDSARKFLEAGIFMTVSLPISTCRT